MKSLIRCFTEKSSSTIVSIEDVKCLHSVLLEVIRQSKEMGAENADEVMIMSESAFQTVWSFQLSGFSRILK
jgi:hypothetical protein